MDRLKELYEAKTAAQELIERTDKAIASLKSASSWGTLDILGGGQLSSFIKRANIKNANNDIEEIYRLQSLLNKELEDVDMQLPAEIGDSLSDNMLDIFFDNIFTDVRVQREIKEELSKLENYRSSVAELLEKLALEIEKLK